MSAAFTPGPWHADKLNAWNVWSSDCKVARTFNVGQAPQYREPTEDERVANARLIAAAPELYEALEACRDILLPRIDRALAKKVDGALAKARGEQQ